MADISSITLPNNGGTYNLKDKTARLPYEKDGYANVKALFLGDSYNYGTGGTGGRGWGYYAQSMLGCTATIVHQNGGGFAAVGNNNATYPAKTYAQCVPQISATDFDLIFVTSGWNDASTDRNPNGVSAIVTGVNDFISAARIKWPNAKLIIIPTNNDTEINQYKSQCLNAISQTALINGVKSSRYSQYWMKNSGDNATDLIHLNDAGYQLLASYIVSFLRGWDGVVSHIVEVALTDASGTGITVSNNLLTIYRDENWACISGDVTINSTLSQWSTIVTGLPIPVRNLMISTSQWSSNVVSGSGNIDTYVIRRSLRAQVETTGALSIRYGSPGNYRITLTYPIAKE